MVVYALVNEPSARFDVSGDNFVDRTVHFVSDEELPADSLSLSLVFFLDGVVHKDSIEELPGERELVVAFGRRAHNQVTLLGAFEQL